MRLPPLPVFFVGGGYTYCNLTSGRYVVVSVSNFVSILCVFVLLASTYCRFF